MPRARIDEADVKAAVAEKAAAAGGRIGHNELVEQFESEGRGNFVSVAVRLAQAGVIKSVMESQSEGRAVLKYWVEG